MHVLFIPSARCLKTGVLFISHILSRMINPPKLGCSGHVGFEKTGGRGNVIENYTVCQTIENLNVLVLDKYNEENGKATGKAAAESEGKEMPELLAVKKWLDNYPEISLKKAIENMVRNLKFSALIIRSINLKAISALQDLGLKLPANGKMDLLMAFVSGEFLYVMDTVCIVGILPCSSSLYRSESL